VPGSRGYKYFGAAKDLPGVKELFEQEVIATKKSKAELLREIDAEYYGYLDDEDFLLLPAEEKCELEARQRKIEEFKATSQVEVIETEEELMPELAKLSDESDEEDILHENYYTKKIKAKAKLVKPSDVPSMKEVEEAILEKKKKELMNLYVSEELQEKVAEVKILAGTVV